MYKFLDNYDLVVETRILAIVLLGVNDQGKSYLSDNNIKDIFGDPFDYKQYYPYDPIELARMYLRNLELLDLLNIDSFNGGFVITISNKAKEYFLQKSVPGVQENIKELNKSTEEHIKSIESFKNSRINKLNEEVSQLNLEKKLLFTFDPDKLSIQISQTKMGIRDIQNQIRDNELLSSLIEPVEELQEYITRIEKVTNIYSDVFLNIIRPIQIESKSGVRATAKWAIISIVAATIISVIISNWGFIINLFK